MKTGYIVGIAAALVVLYLLFHSASQQAAPQRGIGYDPYMYTPTTMDNIAANIGSAGNIVAAGSSAISGLTDAFSGTSSTNDPGLYDDSEAGVYSNDPGLNTTYA